MKPGFYSIAQAGGDQDPADDEAYGLAALTHFRDGQFVGVDPGGCKVSGEYRIDEDGRIALHLNYDFRAGIELANGTIFDRAPDWRPTLCSRRRPQKENPSP